MPWPRRELLFLNSETCYTCSFQTVIVTCYNTAVLCTYFGAVHQLCFRSLWWVMQSLYWSVSRAPWARLVWTLSTSAGASGGEAEGWRWRASAHGRERTENYLDGGCSINECEGPVDAVASIEIVWPDVGLPCLHFTFRIPFLVCSIGVAAVLGPCQVASGFF